MAEEKDMSDHVHQIQKSFTESLDSWTDIILEFEVKTGEMGILPKQYSDDSMMDVTVLFRHLMFNIGFYRGLIDENNAEELGNELAALIKKYTGIDTKTFYHMGGFSKN